MRHKIIQSFPIVLRQICHQYMSSFHTTAYERENASIVLYSLLEKKLCENVNTNEMLQNLMRALHGKKASTRRKLNNRNRIDQLTDTINSLNSIGIFAVGQKIYESLGLMARQFSNSVQDGDKMKIRDMFFKTLEDIVLNQCDVSCDQSPRRLNTFPPTKSYSIPSIFRLISAH